MAAQVAGSRAALAVTSEGHRGAVTVRTRTRRGERRGESSFYSGPTTLGGAIDRKADNLCFVGARHLRHAQPRPRAVWTPVDRGILLTEGAHTRQENEPTWGSGARWCLARGRSSALTSNRSHSCAHHTRSLSRA